MDTALTTLVWVIIGISSVWGITMAAVVFVALVRLAKEKD